MKMKRKNYSDTELLDYLQKLTNQHKYTGRVVMRDSVTDRGWRLHETSGHAACSDVRKAITRYINAQ